MIFQELTRVISKVIGISGCSGLSQDDVDRMVKDAEAHATGEDLDAIGRATEALQKASHRMAEQLYTKQASGPGAQATGKEDAVKDGEVVDA